MAPLTKMAARMASERLVTAMGAALAAGGFVGLTLVGLAAPLPAMIGAGAGFGLRGLAIARGLALPSYKP